MFQEGIQWTFQVQMQWRNDSCDGDKGWVAFIRTICVQSASRLLDYSWRAQLGASSTPNDSNFEMPPFSPQILGPPQTSLFWRVNEAFVENEIGTEVSFAGFLGTFVLTSRCPGAKMGNFQFWLGSQSNTCYQHFMPLSNRVSCTQKESSPSTMT